LWASTSTKNPDYPDTLYVDSLIGPLTVNTVPPATLNALIDHTDVENRLELDTQASHLALEQLANYGIDFAEVTERLQEQGVDAFARSFQSMLDSIRSKRDQILEVSDV
jgi:transaldolase